jgi:hypothetical protein
LSSAQIAEFIGEQIGRKLFEKGVIDIAKGLFRRLAGAAKFALALLALA